MATKKAKPAPEMVKVKRQDKGVISIPKSDVERYVKRGEWKVVK